MADPTYPSVKIPPKHNKAPLSKTGAFNAFINQHPTMRPYADTISKWAGVYGVDRTVMAALFWKESFAEATAEGADPATIESPTGAGVGIGQINPNHVGSKTPWGATVTQSDLTNPEFNIRWSTWFYSQQLANTGNIDTAYSDGYNPGYTGPALSKLLPKGYVPSSGLNPTQGASVTVEKKAAAATLNDPWVVVTPKGGFKYVNSPTPPKNVLTYGGAPVSRNGQFAGAASFTQVWTQAYEDQFEAFTGRKATPKEIQQILKNAPSIYALQQDLATRPTFSSSPVWKAQAPGLISDAQRLLGANWQPGKAGKALIAQAIMDSWTQGTFEQKVRQLPGYENGPEYKTNLASNTQAFETTYGVTPDDSVKGLIASVTKAGWTAAQFQGWLMSQKAYRSTPSYQAKTLSFLTQLGLITGNVPTLSKDQVDATLTAGDNLTMPSLPQPGTAPSTAPGSTPQTPVDKPTGYGPTGYGQPPTPPVPFGEPKNEAPFTRKVG